MSLTRSLLTRRGRAGHEDVVIKRIERRTTTVRKRDPARPLVYGDTEAAQISVSSELFVFFLEFHMSLQRSPT